MGILIAVYLVIAGVLGAAKHEGIVKDDNWESTIRFEHEAAHQTALELDRYTKTQNWQE